MAVTLADDIRELRTACPDWGATEALKADLARLRTQRTPFYLTGDDLESIFRWKLSAQYGRGKRLRDTNSEAAYRIATTAAFSVDEPDDGLDLELRVGFLTTLCGVGVPVASAILALVEPERYCVIDFRGWRAVFGERRQTFGIPQYRAYLGRVREVAAELAWSPQETDLAIWELDRRRHGAA